jgi:micrococcal nuclease
MFEYRCEVKRVVDGDTVDVDIDLGFGVWLRKQRIRLYGIDTPESRTRDLEEKKYGIAAKDYLIKWLSGGGVTIKTHKDAKGKFGRILGELWCFDVNVNEKMIEEHHAVRYHGQSKDDIAEEHLKNRELVQIDGKE